MNSELLIKQLQQLTPLEGLKLLSSSYEGGVKMSTAFGKEGQALIHMIAKAEIPIEIFTIDTGRLFAETYELMDTTRMRFGVKINTYYPQTDALQKLVTQKGSHSFYESVDNRKECCFIRKVEPLRRALSDAQVWVTGLRGEQSDHRKEFKLVEWNEDHQLIKYNPIINWSDAELLAYLTSNNVPYNKLHDQGFKSIGCAPCTRAVLPGEEARAGRWWWEGGNRECGLHVKVSA